jgi:hypothetical protein
MLLALAVAAVLGDARAQGSFDSTGGTAVTVDGSTVTIGVTIDLLLGGVGETELPEGAQQGADELAAEIASYWNQGLARLASDCLSLRLSVKINALPMSEHRLLVIDEDRIASVTTPGHHVVIWGVNNWGNAAPPLTYDPYDEDGYAPPGEDYGSPYEHELYADWSPRLEDARDLAHEFGHLLGLGDDYGEGGEALPGREGTLMADGDLIDQNLVDRLAGLARGANPDVPACETWAGTMDLALSKDYLAEQSGLPRQQCDGTWRVDVRFTVLPDESISGKADARLVSGPDCTFSGARSGKRAAFDVTGTSTAESLELRFEQTSIEPPGDLVGFQAAMGETLAVERTGDRAAAAVPISTTEAGPFPVTGSAELSLECVSCG